MNITSTFFLQFFMALLFRSSIIWRILWFVVWIWLKFCPRWCSRQDWSVWLSTRYRYNPFYDVQTLINTWCGRHIGKLHDNTFFFWGLSLRTQFIFLHCKYPGVETSATIFKAGVEELLSFWPGMSLSLFSTLLQAGCTIHFFRSLILRLFALFSARLRQLDLVI